MPPSRAARTFSVPGVCDVECLEKAFKDLGVQIAAVAGEPGAQLAADVLEARHHHGGGHSRPGLRRSVSPPDQLLPHRILGDPAGPPLEQQHADVVQRHFLGGQTTTERRTVESQRVRPGGHRQEPPLDQVQMRRGERGHQKKRLSRDG
jgi:hypothetical protein